MIAAIYARKSTAQDDGLRWDAPVTTGLLDGLVHLGTSPGARLGNWNQQFIEIAGRTAAWGRKRINVPRTSVAYAVPGLPTVPGV
jgi:hypothetical protein